MAQNIKPLHMQIADKEDILVISSLFQDAVAKIGDMGFFPDQRRFALVANRFVWEDGVKKRFGPFTRVRAGMHFDDVLSVKTKNLRLDAPKSVVEILTMRFEPGEDGNGIILIDLAGGGAIMLEVESLNGEMHDISAPWRTQNKPDHKVR
jgi:urease beta subunit